MKPKQPPGPPMTLGNMRELGGLNPKRHPERLDVDGYGNELLTPSLARMACTSCGTIGADARPNWNSNRRPKAFPATSGGLVAD